MQLKAIALSLGLLPALAGAAEGFLDWESFDTGTTRWSAHQKNLSFQPMVSTDVGLQAEQAFGGRVEVADPALAEAGFSLSQAGNLAEVDELAFDIYVGTRASWQMSVVLDTADAGKQELPAAQLRPGWNRDLRSRLKGLPGLNNVRSLLILLKPAVPAQGALYLNRLRLLGPGASKLAPARLPGLKPFLADSFEGQRTRWAAGGGAALRVSLEEGTASQGQKALSLESMSKNPSQSSIFGLDGEYDFSGIQSVSLDVYNPGEASTLALTLATGEAWRYMESLPLQLRHGWNRNLTFDMQAKTFKCEASYWNYDMAIQDGMKAKKFGLMTVSGQIGSSRLLIDNLRLRATDERFARPFMPEEGASGLETTWEDFNTGNPFSAVSWSSARGTQLSRAYTVGGNPSLELSYRTASGGVTAVYQYLRSLDLQGVRALRFDAYNPNPGPVEVGMVLQMGESQDWTVSKPTVLSPGWNKGLSIALEGKVFKNSGSNWTYAASLPSRKAAEIKSAYLEVFPNRAESGSVYLSNMVMVRRPDLGLIGLPGSVNASVSAFATMSAFSYALWDSGSSEGGFEKGLGAWSGSTNADYNLSVAQISADYASQGSSALRLNFVGRGANSAVLVYDPGKGAPLPDLSNKSKIRLDVFNPGRPMGFSIAFNLAGGVWMESLPLALKPGWNRDLTIDLDGLTWKAYGASTQNNAPPFGGTVTFNPFPAEQRRPGMISKMTLLFKDSTIGSAYVDNIRFAEATPSIGSFEAGAGADLSLNLFPMKNVELKLGLTAGKSQDGSAYVLPGPGRLSARLLGQSASLFFGEPFSPFDDPLQVLNGRVGLSELYGNYVKLPGQNLAGIEQQGLIGSLQIQTLAALPWQAGLYAPGSEALLGFRAKNLLPGGSTIGAGWFNHRVGYDPGADYLNAGVEQSVQVAEADARLRLPYNLNLLGEVAQSMYERRKGLLTLQDNEGIRHFHAYAIGDQTMAYTARGDVSFSLFSVSGFYKEVGKDFYTQLSDEVFGGGREHGAEINAQIQDLWPFSRLSAMKSWVAGFARGAKTQIKYEDYTSTKDTYRKAVYSVGLENDQNQPVGYKLRYSNAHEGNAGDLAASPVAYEGRQWYNRYLLLLKATPLKGLALSAGARDEYGYRDTASQNRTAVYGVEATQKLWKGAQLSASYGCFNFFGMASDGVTRHNLHARLEQTFHPQLSGQISYGFRPFYGYEYSLAWLETYPRLGLNLNGSF